MTVTLELPSDYVCSTEHPVVVFAYSVLRLALEVRFSVDESCLYEFRNQIAQARQKNGD